MNVQARVFGEQFAKLLEEYDDEIFHGGIEMRIEYVDDGALSVTVVKVLKEFEPLKDFTVSPDGDVICQ